MIEGLEFKPRHDDAEYVPTAADIHPEAGLAMIATEQSWNNPEEFGAVESKFSDHVAMISRRSQELGIINEYSDDLLAAKADITDLYEKMVSYDQFYQMMCACPEDFGMTDSFVEDVFSGKTGDNHGDLPDKDRHGHDHHHTNESDEEKKRKKKREREAKRRQAAARRIAKKGLK